MSAIQFRNGAVYILMFVGALALLLFTMDRGLYPYDEGVIYEGAMRAAEGAVPHRDYYANYGPAQFYLLALLFKTIGPTAIVARIWGCLVKAMIVCAVCRIAQRISGRLPSVLCAGVSLIWLCKADMAVWPAWPALLLSLLSASCLIDSLEGKTGRLLPAGCFVGLAALFRYDIGVLVFLAEFAALALHSIAKQWPEAPSLSSILRGLRSYIIGASIIILPLLCWYIAVGALSDFIFDVVSFPSKQYAAMRSLPFPPVPTSIPAWWTEYVVYSPVVISVLGSIMLLSRWKTAVDSARQPAVDDAEAPWWPAFLLLLLLLAFFAKGLVRVSVIHMTPAVVLAALVATTFRPFRGRPLSLITITIAAIVLVPPTVSAIDEVRYLIGRNADFAEVVRLDSSSRAHTGLACKSYPCSSRSRLMRLDPSEAKAIDFIVTHTVPGEPIFSGLPHHDRLVVNDVMFYFLSGREPATKWYHFDPGLQTSAEIQQEIINDLRARRPRYAVLNGLWDDIKEPNASADSSGVFLLDEFLAAQYQAVARFGVISILELKL